MYSQVISLTPKNSLLQYLFPLILSFNNLYEFRYFWQSQKKEKEEKKSLMKEKKPLTDDQRVECQCIERPFVGFIFGSPALKRESRQQTFSHNCFRDSSGSISNTRVISM